MTWILPFSVLASVALGLFTPVLYRWFGLRLGRVLALYPLGLFVYFFGLARRIADGETFRAVYHWFRIPLEWLPSSAGGGPGGIDINFGFSLDGLAFLFVLLITGVGALVLFYAGFYLSKDEDHGAFFSYLMIFIGAMLGVVMADNLFVMYMFWEATSITSFLLIGFWSHRKESREGALKALLVTAGGGLALLAGFVFLLVITGSADMATILAGRDVLLASPLYPVVLVLVLIGALTKSAQAPFHLWLPNAMEAPTPVSAYLHSAAMVKAGIYLLARMAGILGGSLWWIVLVSTVGIISLVLGAFSALRQTDLKAILAFSTISQLGLIVALFGWGTPTAVTAAIFHILNHSVFKAALFMVVGIVDKQTHSRDIRKLKALGTVMPITGGLALISSLALAGVPPLNGFVSKEMFFAASLEVARVFSEAPVFASLFGFVFPVLAVLGSILTFVYSLIISYGVFYGGRKAGQYDESGRSLPEASWKEPSFGLWFPPAVLAALAVVLGLVPAVAEGSIVAPAARVVLGRTSPVSLALWHGFNTPLAMSLAVIAIGIFLYARLNAWRPGLLRFSPRWHMNALYDWGLDALTRMSEFVEARTLTGFTRDYIAYLLGFMLIVLVWTVGRIGAFPMHIDWPPQSPLQWVGVLFAALMAFTAVAVSFMRTRVAMVVALGAVGTGMVMLWTLFQAPDLAISMLVVETVTLLLFLLVFVYLPRLKQDVTVGLARGVNVFISAGTGVAVTWLLLGVRGLRLTRPISDWYIENSLSLANGKNVVNVILVDFRGFDTLFEITVLALAGLGVYILSNLRYKGGPK